MLLLSMCTQEQVVLYTTPPLFSDAMAWVKYGVTQFGTVCMRPNNCTSPKSRAFGSDFMNQKLVLTNK